MAQAASSSVSSGAQRSFSVAGILALLFAVVMLAGNFLPLTSTPVTNLPASTTIVLILGVVAVGLALWRLLDVRMRFVVSLLHLVIGLIAVFNLFNFVSVLATTPTDSGAIAHVGTGFWIVLVGALGLIVQVFFPRPAMSGVNIYGEDGLRDFMGRMGVLGELLGFLWKRKLYWLIPMMMTLMIFIVLIIAGSNSAIAPFIYTVF